eukprot:TRINITY_DN15465_c0_g1_i3.p1 TRINITY_DN15465_c0_g1~~TRINITY_DN15465_c0_g1_i3.p1  ORF type:complete len:232 (+),score=28.96 TRINITY_DN15465_c0_g1_i3:71-766(+)
MAIAAVGICVTLPSTYMIKNVPSRCGRDDVLDCLDALGFAGTYDFFYLPVRDPRVKSQNYGYAFVNFVEPAIGAGFKALVESGSLQIRQKVASVAEAEVQGLANLRQHFRDSCVTSSPGGPMLFSGGSQPTRIAVQRGGAEATPTRHTQHASQRPTRLDTQAASDQQASILDLPAPLKIPVQFSNHTMPLKVVLDDTGVFTLCDVAEVQLPFHELATASPRFMTSSMMTRF